MNESLLEKFEEGGGERIRRCPGRDTNDSWGAIFPEIDEAVRAIASVSLWVGTQEGVLGEWGRGNPEDREDDRVIEYRRVIEEMDRHFKRRVSIQSFGLSWIVS